MKRAVFVAALLFDAFSLFLLPVRNTASPRVCAALLDESEQSLRSAGGKLERVWQIGAEEKAWIFLHDADAQRVAFELRSSGGCSSRFFIRELGSGEETEIRAEEGYTLRQIRLAGESAACVATKQSEAGMGTEYLAFLWGGHEGGAVRELVRGRKGSPLTVPVIEYTDDRVLLFGTEEKEGGAVRDFLIVFDQEGKELTRIERDDPEGIPHSARRMALLPRRGGNLVLRMISRAEGAVPRTMLLGYDGQKKIAFCRDFPGNEVYPSVTPLGDGECLRGRFPKEHSANRVYDLYSFSSPAHARDLFGIFRNCELLAAEKCGVRQTYFVLYKNRTGAQMYGYLSLEEEKPERKLFLGEHEPAHIQSDLVQPRFFRDAAGHLMMAGTRIDRPCIEAYRLSLPTP